MLPRWHIFFGAIFSLLIWIISPKTPLIYIALLFISIFIMDFDHYLCFFLRTKKLGLFHSFKYHKEMLKQAREEKKKGIKRKGDFHLFHTVEFHILVGLLSISWNGFFYIFLGMVFHSLLDIYSILYESMMYRREFFLVHWLWMNIIKRDGSSV